jgi:hypothetical protein
MRTTYDGKESMEIGAAVNLTEIWEKLQETATTLKQDGNLIKLCFIANFFVSLLLLCVGSHKHRARGLDAMMDQLYWFSGTSIRNAACLGGNIVTASPISDLNPVLVALGAKLRLHSASGSERVVPAADFFLNGYRKVNIKPDEVLISVLYLALLSLFSQLVFLLYFFLFLFFFFLLFLYFLIFIFIFFFYRLLFPTPNRISMWQHTNNREGEKMI